MQPQRRTHMINRTMGGVSAALATTAWLTAILALLPPATASAAGSVHRFNHVVIVVMENKNYSDIIGRPDEAPYLNSLAAGGAVFSHSFAVAHPSQPNYLALFSGSAQGVTGDDCPHTFTGVPNLGSELNSAGLSFSGYSKSMASAGY